MDSLIQRWKSTVGSGKKSQSFSQRSEVSGSDEVSLSFSRRSVERSPASSSQRNREKNQFEDQPQSNTRKSRGPAQELSSSSSSSSSDSDGQNKKKKSINSNPRRANEPITNALDFSASVKGVKAAQGSTITAPPLKPPLKQLLQQPQSPFKRAPRSPAHSKNSFSSLTVNSSSHLDNSMDSSLNIALPREVTFFMDESVFKLVEAFKPMKNGQFTPMSEQEKIKKVRMILRDFYEHLLNNLPAAERPRSQSKGETAQQQQQQTPVDKPSSQIKATILGGISGSGNGTPSSTMQELERKIVESERSRIALKNENEKQQARIEALQRELNAVQVAASSMQFVRESQVLLEKNNRTLHEQLRKEEARNAEQQKIFENQLNEVALIIGELKQQLADTYNPQR